MEQVCERIFQWKMSLIPTLVSHLCPLRPYLPRGSSFKPRHHNGACIIYDKDKKSEFIPLMDLKKAFRESPWSVLFEKCFVDWLTNLHPLKISFRVTNEVFDLEQTDARLAYTDNNTLWSAVGEIVNGALFPSRCWKYLKLSNIQDNVLKSTFGKSESPPYPYLFCTKGIRCSSDITFNFQEVN